MGREEGSADPTTMAYARQWLSSGEKALKGLRRVQKGLDRFNWVSKGLEGFSSEVFRRL